MISSVLIANRGEIACRIIRSCRRLGVRTVAVYSDADRKALHVQLADEALHIGPSAPSQSYLNQSAILKAAELSDATAIHPGYGFLSENAGFARAVRDAGLVFIGPDAETIDRMGSKAAAKQIMEDAGVPVVPGYHGSDQDDARLKTEADRIGFPLMVKAAAGGGGKGMRIVRDADGFIEAAASARREAGKSFGDERLILERYLENPRHIEFQIFGDRQGNVIHLGERDCSSQRRYQKVIEEAPAPNFSNAMRQAMGEAAVSAAKAVDYVNAGTVEFIVSGDDFFFMEMNTRLQVEHPVTEMITGEDLVEWQLRIASGDALPCSQADVDITGHAFEARLYAEDPDNDFLPGSGRLTGLDLPGDRPGVRIDTGVSEGDEVTVHYDPMIAKLVVHAADREAALALLARALADCAVFGPKDNLGFLQRLADHDRMQAGEFHTAYLDRHPEEFQPEPSDQPADLIASVLATRSIEDRRRIHDGVDPFSPWATDHGWHTGGAPFRTTELELSGQPIRALMSAHDDGSETVGIGDNEWLVEGVVVGAGQIAFGLAGSDFQYQLFTSGDAFQLTQPGKRLRGRRLPLSEAAQTDSGSGDDLRAPMPGQIVAIQAGAGDKVAADSVVIIMEAMKMELSLRAPRDAMIAAVHVSEGDFVSGESVLVEFEPEQPDL